MNTKSKPRILCLSGPARNGKDQSATYIAEALREQGCSVLVTHFADLLKFMAKNLYGWQGDKDGPARYEINGKAVNGRGLLQVLGTDIIRAKDPDLWVNFVIKEMKLLGYNWDYVIIPDCRFPNEIDRFREEGYDAALIKVIRPGFNNGLTEEQKSHPSERAMDGYPADIVIVNNSDIDRLKRACRSVARIILGADRLESEYTTTFYTSNGRMEGKEKSGYSEPRENEDSEPERA